MEQKHRFITLAQSGHFTLTELCEEFGITRKMGHKWLGRYAAVGRAAGVGSSDGYSTLDGLPLMFDESERRGSACRHRPTRDEHSPERACSKRTWVGEEFSKRLSEAQAALTFCVEVENPNGGPPDRGAAHDAGVFLVEVLGPAIAPRVEKPADLGAVWMNPGEVGAFVQITVWAGEGEVDFVGDAAVLPWNDVLNVE